MIASIEQQAKEARDKAFYDASVLMQTYHWDQKTDARITTIGKLIRILVALQLSLSSLRRLQVATDEEWSALFLPSGENTDRRPYLLVFELVTKTGFIAALFTAVESSLRVFLNHIDPASYSKYRLRTRELIHLLLLEKLSRPHKSEFESVDFLRTLRNTLHSNGVFHPPDAKSVTFSFKGTSYDFEPEQRVNFASWQLVLDLADDMRQISFRLARDPVISSLAPTVTDPWSMEL
ncbi:MAG: hypothetical protein WD906_00055 [Anaerolineales bacterium]